VKGVIDEEKMKGVLMLKRWIPENSWKKLRGQLRKLIEEFVPFALS
jgi:hypothetical protein